jgi:hypothetical protein
VQNSRSLARSEHRRHDRLLVTRFAVDDAYPSERDEAQALIESCADCAALAADIRNLSASMSRLPAAKRPRDFMISAEKAEQLRGNRLTRWLGALAMPRFGVLRPVAGVALSIGLVMAVVGTSLPGFVGGPASAGAPADNGRVEFNGPDVAPAPANPEPPYAAATPEAGEGMQGPVAAQGSPAPGGKDDPRTALATVEPLSQNINDVYLPQESPDSVENNSRDETVAAAPTNPTRDLLLYGGLAIAALSLGLLSLAWIARRYFADPLLR